MFEAIVLGMGVVALILLVDISRSLDIIKRQGGHGKPR